MMKRLADQALLPAQRLLEFLLLLLARMVNATGFLDTSWGHGLFLVAYRRYKRGTDWQLLYAMRRLVPEGANVMDVGANVGVVTLWAAECVGAHGQVAAIEPEARNLRDLRGAVDAARFSGRVVVCEAVAADRPGILRLRINRAHPADHRIDADGVPVQALTLDGLAKSLGWTSLAFVKIDVQGAESLVLRGAENLLHTMRPILWVEISGEDLAGFTSTPRQVVEFLNNRGYLPYRLQGRVITLVDAADIEFRVGRRGYIDVLFIPTERSREATTP